MSCTLVAFTFQVKPVPLSSLPAATHAIGSAAFHVRVGGLAGTGLAQPVLRIGMKE